MTNARNISIWWWTR
ncbi:trpE operon leader peptide TrpLE [Ensifer canadensis]